MSRGILIRFVLVLGLLAGCVALVLTREPRLGLDLRGGTQITLQTKSTDRVQANSANTDRAIEVLRGRVDALGISEPSLTRSGSNRILVELPDVQDPREAIATLGRTAQLAAHPVLEDGLAKDTDPGAGNVLLPDNGADETGPYLKLGPAVLTGAEIKGASPEQPENQTQWVVSIKFNKQGRQAWQKETGLAACAQGRTNRVAFVLDGEVISAPTVGTEFCPAGIPGNTVIESFPHQEAKDLSILIEGGALPLPVEVIEQRTVGPTLGAAAIEASWKAAILGLVLTLLFIAFVYRLVGFLATLALTSYALLSFAILLALGSTLTLPGLAGFVLAIGMAIDANVLVFERAREEYAANPAIGLPRALAIGFNKAWTAIIDSNMTTLLAAALLFFLGSGPIKGFGVTLSIGVIASMISALIIARVLTEIAVNRKWLQRRPAISGLANEGRVRQWLEANTPDLMSRRNLWLGISGVALVAALAGIFAMGLNLGVEFTGGRTLEYSTAKNISADTARDAVVKAGFPEATVQKADNDKIAVKVGQISDDQAIEIQNAISEVGGKATKQKDEKIGASLGKELRNKALIAFGIAFIVQLIYLAVRFKWTFGVAAVLAMFHDVVIVVGVFAWLQRPIDGVFLAAAMTIIGLSVNDTVVVFDRIRERWYASRGGGTPFNQVANKACVETMPRTVNTGLGAMFILAALAIFGGDSLRDFSIALLLGLIIGTYSSVFVATPLLTYLQTKWPLSRSPKVKMVRDNREDSGAVV